MPARLYQRGIRFCAVLLSLGLVLSIAAYGQSTRGAITGTVADSSGGLIVGATVTLNSPSTGVTATVVTNGSGIYRFEALLVGDYIVAATAPGFNKSEAPATVTVGALVGRDFVLAVGDAGATVEVKSFAGVDLQTE